MPVGTYGSVRGLTPAQLVDCGAEIVLSNSYHLALRPGAETISKLGGLHRFMGWERPILTDSGGYQLFSLAAQVKIDEEGAVFRSQYDGARFRLTPELAASNQRLLGVDVGMVFDALTGQPTDRAEAAAAAARTVRWAERTKRAGDVTGQTSLFGIVPGGQDARDDRQSPVELRKDLGHRRQHALARQSDDLEVAQIELIDDEPADFKQSLTISYRGH
jgi:queuine tRNA-ribosyltransferase